MVVCDYLWKFPYLAFLGSSVFYADEGMKVHLLFQCIRQGNPDVCVLYDTVCNLAVVLYLQLSYSVVLSLILIILQSNYNEGLCVRTF